MFQVNLNKIYGMMTQSPHPLHDADGHIYTTGQVIGLTGPKYNIIQFPKDGNHNIFNIASHYSHR